MLAKASDQSAQIPTMSTIGFFQQECIPNVGAGLLAKAPEQSAQIPTMSTIGFFQQECIPNVGAG
ncbi:hypothetical protein ACTZGP_11565, partial [Pseudomonas putida]|uniref:hypothetical protein n=1 Tax=Pseudomonas putida TaxID=303 RepID=UPI003FD3376D